MDDQSDAGGTPAVGHGARSPTTELTVVVPTFNERRNIGLLFERLQNVLLGTEWEIVFVDDDSPDGTCDAIRRLAHQDRRVRLIERIGRRGLSSAVVEGVQSSTAPYFAVMDADLQHDETKLPMMLNRLKSAEVDVVVGSRYTGSGSAEGLSRSRRAVSHLGGRISRIVLGADLTDPMSGFFAVRRSTFDEVARSLSQQGFKILLDIFASSRRPLRFEEVACRFHARRHGESKLDSMVAWEFGMLILDKLVGRYVPRASSCLRSSEAAVSSCI
jgi:dolichol-phosphate mannosyltransferase